MFGIDDAVFGGIAGDIIGGLFGTSSAKKQNKAAAAAAERQYAMNKEMMQNRHQWEVADLRAAGLNPILSAHSAPSMGSVSAAPVVPELDAAANSARDVSKRALERKMAKQDLKTNQAMAGKLGMEAVAADAVAHKNKADEQLTKTQNRILEKYGSAEAISRIIANGGSAIGNVNPFRFNSSKSISNVTSRSTSNNTNTNTSTSRSENHNWNYKGKN